VKWRLIPYNVSDAVTKPRQKRSERDALTLRQVLDFFEMAKGDRFEALYVLVVFTGCALVRCLPSVGQIWSSTIPSLSRA